MPPDSFPLTAEDWSPRLQLPYLAAGQAQKHLTVNEAVSALDGLIQTAVESATEAGAPSHPAEGVLYILPTERDGPEWSLHPPGSLLRYADGGWTRLASGDGALAYAKDAGLVLVKLGQAWRPLGSALGEMAALSRLGLGTEADSATPLAVKLNTALFTARGAGEGGTGDLRLALNKESATDVLSLLFQRGYSGRAELGLVGDDGLQIKTSADGQAWTTALQLDAAGRPRWPAKPAFGTFTSTPRATPGPFTTYVALPRSVNRGGVFDPATGLFTAPVAGAYAFQLVGRSYSGLAARAGFVLTVNGTNLDEFAETYAPHGDVGAGALVDLAVGDKVGVAVTTLEGGQSVGAHFSGWLVG